MTYLTNKYSQTNIGGGVKLQDYQRGWATTDNTEYRSYVY